MVRSGSQSQQNGKVEAPKTNKRNSPLYSSTTITTQLSVPLTTIMPSPIFSSRMSIKAGTSNPAADQGKSAQIETRGDT